MFKTASFPVFRQLDQMDCGPACLKIIAKHFGKNIDLDLLRQYSSLTSGGSSMAGLNEAAEKVGFDCTGAKVSLQQLK
ncbi:MAG: ATP-binding cassette subfamily B protein [Granulosicoccus sp.]|jgi:ATP-binding cassette subfamily B protein